MRRDTAADAAAVDAGITASRTERAARVCVIGDLDYENVEHFVRVATREIAEHGNLVDLHLDFSKLTAIDSAGLAGLLLLRRHTAHEKINLHLDHRPRCLIRLLQITCTVDHFTSPVDAQSSLRSAGEA